MTPPLHPPTFITLSWTKKEELAEASLDVIKKSYEGNIETTSFMALWGKNTEICPG